MNTNRIGRNIPKKAYNIGELTPYAGPFAREVEGRRHARKMVKITPTDTKLVDNIAEAIKKSGLKDGMTISFHHHFRSGDLILNLVVDLLAELGYKNLTLFGSSLNGVHKAIIPHLKNGVITKIHTSGMRGELGEAISNGIMETPVTIRSHGGRARAIESGDVKIDVAFLGVPCSDEYGNANGYKGETACGSLGYALMDAEYADHVILITDNLVPYPNVPASIKQIDVDQVVKIERVGNPEGIVSGATRVSKNPKELQIAKFTANVIESSGYFKNGFSMQTGTGGASLATAHFLKEKMITQNIKASFATGGITGHFVKMLEEGLVHKLMDVQCFDLDAVKSIGQNLNHVEMSASTYASPHNKGAAVNQLDIVILSALEVDIDFNVNVITGSNGVLRGASGGHSDTAAGAKLAIIVAPLVRGRIPTIVKAVDTVVTPGETIDVVVTERGISVNPLRTDLIDKLSKINGLPMYTMNELQQMAEAITGVPDKIKYTDKVVGLVEYRDGTIIDVIYQIDQVE